MYNKFQLKTSLDADEIDTRIQYLINNKQIPVENFLGYVIPFSEFSGKSRDQKFQINADIKDYHRFKRFEVFGTIDSRGLECKVNMHIKYSWWNIVFTCMFLLIWVLNYWGIIPIDLSNNDFIRLFVSQKMLIIVLVWLAISEVLKCVRINKLKKILVALFDDKSVTSSSSKNMAV